MVDIIWNVVCAVIVLGIFGAVIAVFLACIFGD